VVAESSVGLLDAFRKIGVREDQVDFLRDGVVAFLREFMDVEVERQTGAGYGERTTGRENSRNGYRSRPFDTRVGSIDLQIPKLRKGSYFPSFLEPRKRSERALLSVIQEAYVLGVSTRKVEDLVQAGVPPLFRTDGTLGS